MFFLKLIIWNIDIHTCLLDSTFLCLHLCLNKIKINYMCYDCVIYYFQWMLLYLLFKLIVIGFNEVILKYIKIYFSHLFFTHLYIKKKLHSEKKIFYIHRNIHIWHLYIWNRLQFYGPFCLFNWLIIGVIKCGQSRIKPSCVLPVRRIFSSNF